MGFNTYGAASYYYKEKKPYTFQLWFLKSYAKYLNLSTTTYDYYNDFFEPIFYPGWANYCKEYMSTRLYLTVDPYNIGYYPDNELPYYRLSLGEALKRPGHVLNATYKWIKDNNVTNTTTVYNGTTYIKFSTNDNLKFQKYCIDLYWKPVYEAIRGVDKKHMILGTKYASYNQYIWETIGNWVDV